MKHIIFVLVVSLVVVTLVACGGSEPEAPAPVAVAVEGADTLRFNPDTLSFPAGAEVTVTFKNSGGLDHNFVLVSASADPLTVTEADALGGVNAGLVAGGGEKVFTFTAPPVGSYQYVCSVPGHAAGGMVGALTTTAP